MRRHRVGIPGFDEVAQGGLPHGRSTLVAGTSGAGKTLFGLQFLAAGVRLFGETGVLVTLDERPEDLIANVESLGWNFERLIADGQIAVVDASATAAEETIESGSFDFGGLEARIAHAIHRVKARRLLIDPLDAPFSQFTDTNRVRRELGRVIRSLRPYDVTTLVTAERAQEYGPVARFGVEEFMVDNVIILRNALARERRRRTVEILKFRGCDHRKGEYTFAIDPRAGIEVVPTSAIEFVEAASTEPISLGNAELDALCQGGIHSDSVLLVNGATGTGKTLMALQFVCGGLAAGERATLLSLEESPGQIVRNAKSWGIDLESPLQQGRLRILSRYPERMGLEDLLVEIKRELEDFDPSRIVIDGMTALEQISNAKGFREFVVSVYSYLKRHRIAGLMTTAAKTLSGGDSASGANLSTAADGIILLRYLELEGELRRGILVLKLRGRRHDHAVHEYEINDQGMRLLGPIGGLSAILGGPSFMTTEGRQRADLTDALRP